MYINNSTQTLHSEADIRSLFPNTSFTVPFNPPESYSWVFPTPQPEYNSVVQRVLEGVPELTNKGHYEQRWSVVPRFVEYTDESGVLHTVARQESVAIAEAQLAKATELRVGVINAAQERLDAFARTRNYDGILSACTYATSTIPKFAAEGQYAVEARDATWSKMYEVMGEIEAGTRPMITSFAELEAELPVLQWPV